MNDRQRLTARVEGHVQGVGFRWWVRTRAEQLGLTGWVMNEPAERAIALVAEGRAAALDELERQLWRGPAGARVDNVEANRTPASGTYQRFEITRP